jgi:molecular chaperone DnaK (HSP70)
LGYSLGVDLGTTFTAAATFRDSQPEMVTLGTRAVVTPSVVFVDRDGSVVVGDAASRRENSHPDQVARGFKRRLGDPTPLILAGRPHRVVDLMAATLRDVLTRVTESEGMPPERVVLTHPANWGPYRRGLFEDVPALAGLASAAAPTAPGTSVITEPEAAATHYAASRNLGDGQVVAVYDLGGGTVINTADDTVTATIPVGPGPLGVAISHGGRHAYVANHHASTLSVLAIAPSD